MKTRFIISVVFLALLAFAATEYDDKNEGDANNNFYYHGISFKRGGLKGVVEVLGEMENNTGENYSAAFFDFTVYNADEKVIAVDTFSITNFQNDTKRSIKLFLEFELQDLAAYKIDYSFGV